MQHSRSFMDRHKSELHSSNWRMGEVLRNSGVKVFQIETTLNNDTFGTSGPMSVLQKREWEWTARDRATFIGMKAGLDRMPMKARRKIFNSWQAPYGITSVQAGEVEAVHEVTTENVFAQQLVPIEGQTDILTMGLPYICPYNVNSIMNPILVMCLGLGYFFNMYRGQPLVREGGVLIMSHPTPWEFHPVHHPSYIDFFEQVLAETTDPVEIEARYEKQYAEDEWYRHLYRTSYAYHGVHPFYMWYWGCHGMAHVGKVIIVGGEPRSVRRLGFTPASTLQDALEMATDVVGPPPHHHPPAQPADRHGGRHVMHGQGPARAARPGSRTRRRRCPTPSSALPPKRAPRRRLRHGLGPPLPRPARARRAARGGDATGGRRARGAGAGRPRPPGRAHRRPGDLRRQPPQPPRHARRCSRRSPSRGATRCSWRAAADYFFTTHVTSAASALALGAIPMERSKVSRRTADQAAELIDRRLVDADLPRGRPLPRRLGPALPRRRRLPVEPLRRAGRAGAPRGHRQDPPQGRQAAHARRTSASPSAPRCVPATARAPPATPSASSAPSPSWPTRPPPTGGRPASAPPTGTTPPLTGPERAGVAAGLGPRRPLPQAPPPDPRLAEALDRAVRVARREPRTAGDRRRRCRPRCGSAAVVGDDLGAGGRGRCRCRVLVVGVEPGEHRTPRALRLPDPDAVVGDRIVVPTRHAPRSRREVATSSHELERVADQVLQHLPEQGPVTPAVASGERTSARPVLAHRGRRAPDERRRGRPPRGDTDRPTALKVSRSSISCRMRLAPARPRRRSSRCRRRATACRQRHLDPGERRLQVVGGGVGEPLELLVRSLELVVATSPSSRAAPRRRGCVVGPDERGEERLAGQAHGGPPRRERHAGGPTRQEPPATRCGGKGHVEHRPHAVAPEVLEHVPASRPSTSTSSSRGGGRPEHRRATTGVTSDGVSNGSLERRPGDGSSHSMTRATCGQSCRGGSATGSPHRRGQLLERAR